MSFHERMKSIREDMDITQTQLAKKVNSTQRSISHYENGDVEPPYSILIDLAKEFDVSIYYLLGVSDKPRKFGE